MFGGFALRANSLGHLEQIESYAPGHQVRFGSLNYTVDIRGDLIFDGFEPLPSALHCPNEHDLALLPNSAQEAAPASASTLNSEPTAPIEDGWLDTASRAAIPIAIEPNTSPALREARDSEGPDSSPNSEPSAPLPSAPHGHDEHDLALSSDSVQETAPATAPTLNSEPIAPSMDGWIEPAMEAVFSAAIEPSIDLTLHGSRDAELPDSYPATDSEPPAPVPIEFDWAPIMEFM